MKFHRLRTVYSYPTLRMRKTTTLLWVTSPTLLAWMKKLRKKLLKKQAAGKKRMKQFGKVEVPQEAFMAVLKVDQNAPN